MQEDQEKQSGFLAARFQLGGVMFAVDARLVQEVVKVGRITPVHGAPHDVAGIRNLRGDILTVIDMACYLGLGKVDITPHARLLIMQHQGESFGFMVESVTDALVLDEERIDKPPASISAALRKLIHGVWRDGGNLTSVLSSDALFKRGGE